MREISENLQNKIKTNQEIPKCKADRNVLIYNNFNRLPYNCGLGCFLHTIVNGLVLAEKYRVGMER